ncbi:serine hydrolase [Sphingomonas sp. Leaf357]|uniref:serine hydrolase domain-containing protein n=1 Tax=Sphingomonas sp. Leaf357 TaxID=1736350 RepID=UPI0006F42950|nr:serine hydrolase domain-containing protein [Sphingomonas sp. Leaf357]KQS02127.1 serine hydrolase [Sphingomonas sp. Leaf357]
MKSFKLLASAGLGAVLLTGAGFAQTAPAPSAPVTAAPAPTLSAVPSALPATQAVLDGYVRDNKMPGIVAAFGIGDGPTMFLSAGTIADGPSAAKAGPDSLWRVYSMTKPITGMAAMILVEEGKLKLDDPVSKYIPAFKDMKVLDGPDSLASHPAVRPVTIRMLLTHSAGLGYSIITKGPLLAEYKKLGIDPAQVNNDLEAQSRKVRPATLEEFANRVASLPLVYEPGTKWSYSIGLDVMGRVIEVASGMSFDGFVQKRIFDPLKMSSSFWTVPQSEVSRLSTNYIFTRAAMAQFNPSLDTSKIDAKARIPLDAAATSVWLKAPSFPYGGAGLVMSARDYDRFLHMLQNYGTLDGVRIMKTETAKLAMSNLLPMGVVFSGTVAATGGNTGGPKMGFGAGGSVYLEDFPGGAGKGTYGWGGAAGTVAFVDPARHARGNVMVNYFPGDTYPIRTEVLPAFLSDVARMTAK